MSKYHHITHHLSLAESEIEFSFIRSPGPGGQNVNKVASAVQLRFNVKHSSLPEEIHERAIKLAGTRATLEGIIVIKATSYRTQERNKQDAIHRLISLLHEAATPPKPRKKTKPTHSSVLRRLDSKKIHSRTKQLRRNQSD